MTGRKVPQDRDSPSVSEEDGPVRSPAFRRSSGGEPTPAQSPEGGTANGEVRLVCVHCSLPVPKGMVQRDPSLPFCCEGCRTVYHMLHEHGLEDFYRYRDTNQPGQAAVVADHTYGELDDEGFQQRFVQHLSDGSCQTEFYLDGVHCSACVWLVERVGRVVPGVLESRLDLRRSLVRVRWAPEQTSLSRVARALARLGYPPHPAKDRKARDLRRREDRRFLIRLGVAGVCAGNVMTLAFALYGGEFSGMEAEYSRLFRWTSMAFGLIALLWPGQVFLRGAWGAVRTRTAHLDLPIALALFVGTIAGSINVLLDRGDVYFDSLTMLIFLLLAGRWVQQRQQRWSSDAVELLFSLTPATAHRFEEGAVRDVPVESLVPGDEVEVRSGETIPIDGIVLEGNSAVDRSLLTGESRPERVVSGDRVFAGTINLSAAIRVRADVVGRQTRIGKLMELVERCTSGRSPIIQLADRAGAWFVLIVIALALGTMAVWSWWDVSAAVDHTVALLIVACPCGLGLATPLAVSVAIGRAARQQVLISDGRALEVLARTGDLLLDKTGTLTLGRSTVVHWHGDDTVAPLVVALESHSAHPVARALLEYFSKGNATAGMVEVEDVREQPARGIEGTVGPQRVAIGSERFMHERGVACSREVSDLANEWIGAGLSPVYAAVDGAVVGVAAIGDPLRGDVPESLRQLQELGWEPSIISGDHHHLVDLVGQQLRLPPARVRGELSPEEKANWVRTAMETRPVVMVGDGVNDGVALAAASVGVAVRGGAEASLAAADVYLNRPGLAPLVELIRQARHTRRVIWRVIGWSLAYNSVAAALAAGGLISPLLAAILMPLSSFSATAIVMHGREGGKGS